MRHIPVLSKEIIGFFKPGPGFTMIDCTAGAGGHIQAVLAASPTARILGIDLDQTTAAELQRQFGGSGLDQNVTIIHGSYADLKQIASAQNFSKVDAILLDLGYSSMQIDSADRGFSFQSPGPLDMRFNTAQKLTAGEILNTYPETKQIQIFKTYGEEAFSHKIVRAICKQRQVSPFARTDQVLELIRDALPKPVKHKAEDVARRIFQALRIEVNGELENLKTVLPQALELLKPGGHLAVISFHSLEDRIVKQFMVKEAAGCVCPPEFPTCVCDKASNLRILTRKPVTASEQEAAANPRSKPAKLRVAQRT
jgi:16S rRNA (cytosine1402-N4)-methyltransferase